MQWVTKDTQSVKKFARISAAENRHIKQRARRLNRSKARQLINRQDWDADFRARPQSSWDLV